MADLTYYAIGTIVLLLLIFWLMGDEPDDDQLAH